MQIEARGLWKKFGAREAVADVSFRAQPGTVTGFLGHNGAGKSTTMRLLTGCLAADHGTASIGGIDINQNPIGARACLGYLPEAANGFTSLTILEFLTFAAEARGLWGAQQKSALERVVDMIGLGSALGQCLGQLSKGWRQRAWLGQALLHDPPVLILDEPTDGLDPLQKTHLRTLLARLSADKTILMSTHILEEAEELCDHLIILAGGRVAADVRKAELLDSAGRLAPAFIRLTEAATSSNLAAE